MTMARARLVDPSVTRWYHCLTRCVRRAFLLGEGPKDRKQWIEKRIEELARIFSISVGGFSILDNHLHLLLRLDPEPAAQWSDEEIATRWGKLFPPRDKSSVHPHEPPSSCMSILMQPILMQPGPDHLVHRAGLSRSHEAQVARGQSPNRREQPPGPRSPNSHGLKPGWSPD